LPRRKVTFDTLRRMREPKEKGLTYREIGRRLGGLHGHRLPLPGGEEEEGDPRGAEEEAEAISLGGE
jgi:hypothetical protein